MDAVFAGFWVVEVGHSVSTYLNSEELTRNLDT